MTTTLTQELDHQQAEDVVRSLASLFTVAAPSVVFDTVMPERYMAFCYPMTREIHFRAEEIPWKTCFHEFAHVLYTDYTGSTDEVKSESFAQWFAALSLSSGQDLLDFHCQVCGVSAVRLDATGLLECLACDSAYAIEVF